jgi:small subunit ribosomal protein S6
MNKYELTIVLNPNLEEEALNIEIDKIKEYITRFKGTIEKVDKWGKKKLQYEIKKLNEGYYFFITFISEANSIIEIEKRIAILENVLRFLIVRVN